jgi:hypothetical protein
MLCLDWLGDRHARGDSLLRHPGTMMEDGFISYTQHT